MKQVDGDSSAVRNAKTVPVVVIATPSVVNASAEPGLPGSIAKRVRIGVKTFYVMKMPGYQSGTSSESAT